MSRNWMVSRRLSDEWAGRCRDAAGRRRQFLVVLTREGRVALVMPPGEVAVLNLITVGQLRAVLREAVFALDDPSVERPHAYPVPITGFHLADADEPRCRPRWLTRLFCHRTRPADVGRDTASQNAPTSAGVQPSGSADVSSRDDTAPSPTEMHVSWRRSA